MYKIGILILVFVFFIGCSSTTEVKKEQTTVAAKDKKLAKELFISGSTNEMKGNYSAAIIDYQEALRLDPNPGIHFALAKNFLRIQKLPSALSHAKEAVNGNPENTEYKYLLANVFQAGNQPDSAAGIYEQIIKTDSTDQNAYYALAQIYESTQPLKALELYYKLVDLIGPEWNVLVSIADLNERMGNVEKTIETVEELTELNPSNLKLKKLLIESYLKVEKYDKALKMADELIVEHPNDINLIEYRANSLIQLDRWDEGAAEYEKLSERDDMPIESKIRIGAAFYSHSRGDSLSLSRAKKIFTKIDADTTHWRVKLFLAQIALDEKDDSTAIENFYSAAELAPWNSQIYMSLGGLLFDKGRYDETIELLTPSIKRFPDEFVLNVILGLSYVQNLQYSEAEPFLKKALLLNPDDFTALYGYGVTLNQLNKDEEALIYLERALEKEPENVSLLGTIGLINENLGRLEKSEEIYQKALSIDSTNALVLNNYAYALAERGTELDKALKMVTKALEIDSTNSSYLDTKGWVHYKLGEYDKAKDYIEQSLEANPDNAEVADHLGDVYYKLGDKAKAIEYWQKAYEIDPEREGLKEKIDEGKL
jgi:tetratricopeptide (TPR) repeat protein